MPIKEKHANAAANKQHQQLRTDAAVLSARPLVTQWEKMVVNPIAVNPVRTPALSPFTGAARTFVRTFDIESGGAGSTFNVSATPNLRDTLRINRGSALVLPAGWEMSTSPNLDVSTAYLGRPTLSGNFKVYDGNDDVIGAQKTSWDAAASLDYLAMTGDATTSVGVKVTGSFVGFFVYAWDGAVYQAVGLGAPGDTVTCLPAFGWTRLMVTISGASGWITEWSIKPVAGTTPVLSAADSYNLFMTDASTIGRVSSYRVTALSMLASYSGSTLDNGGTIAAARVRRGFRYDADSEYSALTKLQDHAYRGTLKEGAYVWWLPYDFSELDPRPPVVYDEGTEIHMAGHFDNADASLQLTVTMTVEFYSPLQIFEHEVGPALTDDFVRGYHALDAVPAATCNPKHDSLLRKIVKSGSKAAKSAGSFALSHPEIVTMLASSLL